MAVYRAEVSFDGIVNVGPTPQAGNDSPTITHHAVYFMVGNGDEDNKKFFGIMGLLFSDLDLNTGLYAWRSQYRPIWWDVLRSVGTVIEDPSTWERVFAPSVSFPGLFESIELLEPFGQNGAAFFNGGTLAIEKDEAAGVMRFITPVGTAVHPLQHTQGPGDQETDFDEQNANSLQFVGHGHRMHHPQFDTTAREVVSWWYDGREFVDGIQTFEVEMSSANPGTWRPINTGHTADFADRAFFGQDPSGISLNHAEQQLPLRYELKITWALADDSPQARRTWAGVWRYRESPVTGLVVLDQDIAPEHGAIWLALTDPADSMALIKRSTYDTGRTWFQSTVLTSNEQISSPSINWHVGKLYIAYQEGVAVKQVRSDDLAKTWSAPMTLAVVGTNPRHLVDRDHGMSYYFLVDDVTLFVYRSGDFGRTFTGSRVAVVTPITRQTVAAEIASDNSILVSYMDGSTVKQMRSYNWGNSWS